MWTLLLENTVQILPRKLKLWIIYAAQRRRDIQQPTTKVLPSEKSHLTAYVICPSQTFPKQLHNAKFPVSASNRKTSEATQRSSQLPEAHDRCKRRPSEVLPTRRQVGDSPQILNQTYFSNVGWNSLPRRRYYGTYPEEWKSKAMNKRTRNPKVDTRDERREGREGETYAAGTLGNVGRDAMLHDEEGVVGDQSASKRFQWADLECTATGLPAWVRCLQVPRPGCAEVRRSHCPYRVIKRWCSVAPGAETTMNGSELIGAHPCVVWHDEHGAF